MCMCLDCAKPCTACYSSHSCITAIDSSSPGEAPVSRQSRMPCKTARLLHSSYGKVGPNRVSDDVQGEELKRDGKGTSGVLGNLSPMLLRDQHLWLSSRLERPTSGFVARNNPIRWEKKISGEQFGPVVSVDVPRRLLTRTSHLPRSLLWLNFWIKTKTLGTFTRVSCPTSWNQM